MLSKLMEKAQAIVDTTDAKMSGAFVQVTQELSVDECIDLFNDYGTTHNQNVKKQLRIAEFVKSGEADPRDVSINTVRNSALALLEAHKVRLARK